MTDLPTPRCRIDDAAAFTSTDPYDHEWCKELCAECPAIDWCRSERERLEAAGYKVAGTWHGELFDDILREPKSYSTCGTISGFSVHRRYKEMLCDECWQARREYDLDRYRLRGDS